MSKNILLISTDYFLTPPIGYGGIERIVALAYKYYSKHNYHVDVVSKDGSKYHTFNHDQLKKINFNKYTYIIVYKYNRETVEFLDKLNHSNIYVVLQNNYSEKLDYLTNLKHCKFSVLTEQQRQQFSRHIDASLFITPNSIDIEKFKILGKVRDRDVVYIGSVGQHKSPLSCLNYAQRYNLDIDFYGPLWFTEDEMLYKNRFLSEIKKYNKARLMGECDDSKKVELLNKHKYFIFLTGLDKDTWSEPFGIAPLEAMACGCTVVTQYEKGGHLSFCNQKNSISFEGPPYQLDTVKVRESILRFDYNNIFSKYYPN